MIISSDATPGTITILTPKYGPCSLPANRCYAAFFNQLLPSHLIQLGITRRPLRHRSELARELSKRRQAGTVANMARSYRRFQGVFSTIDGPQTTKLVTPCLIYRIGIGRAPAFSPVPVPKRRSYLSLSCGLTSKQSVKLSILPALSNSLTVKNL